MSGPGGQGRSALVLGATGLVGRHCVELLLQNPAYATVRALTRRPYSAQPGLEAVVVDFQRLDEQGRRFRVDDVYCCLGTTIAAAGSRDAFRRVDVHYVVRSAELAVEQGASRFVVVSAVGADPESRIFYNRAKGEMEAAVRRLPFGAVWVLRPSLLLGRREQFRPGERVAEAVMRPLSALLLGPLRRYRPVDARDVARAMVRLALGGDGGGVVESERIPALAEGAPIGAG